MARPKHPLLTRERIGLAAVSLIDAGHELQVTPLAKQLGVTTSSLYHHVSGRTDIIHAMREALTQQHPVTPPPEGSWEQQIRHTIGRLWITYAEHPRVLPYLLTVPITEPAIVLHYSSIVDALREAHVPETELLITVEALDAFAMGAALDGLSPELTFVGADDATSLGSLMRTHPQGRTRNTRVYELGLTLLLSGIAARGAR